ncbi:pilus assembly PilX family protein [Endozoicomonas atrinae]|uniref:pilus assembly PilX family protein n=1 Tax=Endozoicomonas atrinae TaxID=1333660 RepID=UPI003AFF9FE6
MESYPGRKKQKGSFLLIVMIVMLVMTFSGLFVMEMAMLEEVTVGNEQRTVQVYQVAYSELEAQLAELEGDPSMFSAALSGVQNLTPLVNAPGVQQNVTIRFIGQVPPPPGFSFNNFIGMSFELNSTATIDVTGARSDQSLGVIYVAAKG